MKANASRKPRAAVASGGGQRSGNILNVSSEDGAGLQMYYVIFIVVYNAVNQ